MTMVAEPRQYTPEDLLHLDGDQLYELLNGQLVEKQIGYLAGRCISRYAYQLSNFLEAHPGGQIFSEVTFQCFPHDPDLVRRPDLMPASRDAERKA